ncbi:methyltransferase [Kutzneria viridogrisea]|uniref:O-methyltransferase n=1 Tax=Kutzneria viridogrisea TaxID=47990 RepID=A0ABR6B9H7_9PSEU|nr:hypothetical protein [Kutzneria viridogrisea]
MHDIDQQQRTNHAFQLLRLSEGFGPARALQLAAEIGVADLLGDGPRDTKDLAGATSTHPDALYRLLRALAGVGVFTEVEPARFALTPVGDRLRADHSQSLRSWVLFQALFNGVYAEAGYSLRTGSATVPQVFGESLFDHLRTHPEHGAIFNAAMGEHSRVMGQALAGSCDLSAARQIVDVGGGNGAFLSAILHANPATTGVVYDQPHLADAANELLAANGLAERCTFLGGDFLWSVPAGGDVYLLKGILHNWPDEQVLTILRNCRRALDTRSRLLLVDWVVPSGDTPHPSKFVDLAVLFVYGGRERTKDEYVTLLAEAGLRLTRVLDTESALNVLEVVPV